MGKEAKTNAMRILEREKVPYTAHEYAHEEGVAVAGVDAVSYTHLAWRRSSTRPTSPVP